MQPIVIIGGSGFIGQYLLKLYTKEVLSNIYILMRNIENLPSDILNSANIIVGDLKNKKTLDKLIQPNSIIINLAFIQNDSENKNLSFIKILVDKCKSVGIKRFVQCSTCSVYGSINEIDITEDTVCNPKSEYEIVKHEIEKILFKELHSTDLVIVRPTSVFGAGGKNLEKFIKSIVNGAPIINYLRACLFWKRAMNLVYVETVAQAIKYLSETDAINGQELFIVSQDDDEKNNFYDIERELRKYLGVEEYYIPILPVPSIILKILLWLRHRSNFEPNTRFSNRKLCKLGFKPTQNLQESLYSYIKNR